MIQQQIAEMKLEDEAANSVYRTSSIPQDAMCLPGGYRGKCCDEGCGVLCVWG